MNESLKDEAYARALSLLQEAIEQGGSKPDISEIWSAKDRVIDRYSKVFSPDGIQSLSAEDYHEFLRFENNCHWSGLSRSSKGAADDIEALRQVLQQLVDESVPIADRIDATFGKIPGLSRAVLTPILLIVYPDKYGVWNTPAEKALKQVGLWPSGSGLSQGEMYENINTVLHKLAGDLQVDLWTLDSLWWYIIRQQEAAERANEVDSPTLSAGAEDEDPDDEDDDTSSVDRQDIDTARKLIEKWVPEAENREAILEAFADAITAAHEINKNSWGVTLKQTRVRLNVGSLEALVIRKRPHRDGYLYILLDSSDLTDANLLAFDAAGCLRGDQVYKKQPGAIGLFIPYDRVGEVVERVKETAFLPRVRAAAKARLISTIAKSHSTNVIEYIEDELGRRLPEPGYNAGASIRSDARIWKVAAGERGSIWDIWKKEGYISVGWDVLGDLHGISKEEYDERRNRYAHLDSGFRSGELQPWRFANELRVGDRIIANKGISHVLGIGTITGPYYFVPDTEMGHRYPVKWDDIGGFDIEPFKHWVRTLITVSKDQYKAILAQCPQVGNDDSSGVIVSPNTPYTVAEAISDLFMEEKLFRDIITLLHVKKNVILQGAPGVGKTFVARRLAYALMEEKDEARLEFVQFHQSYSYEDFIQGFRPQEGGGFTLKDGVFYRFCKRAENAPDRPYVFVIDEINRGNLSKIFGELLMLIESDKRGASHSMPLLYSDSRNVRFHVPANVHILGMMNTADRSLAMVDYALRRRFAFVTLPPGFESFRFRDFLLNKGAEASLIGHIVSQMVALNQRIADDTANLGHGFCIGHSFFTPARKVTPDGEWLARVIKHEIEPLLREYYIDKEDEVDAILSNLRGSFC